MSSLLAVVAAGLLVPLGMGLCTAAEVPATAQIIDWKSFNVLQNVPPPAEANDSTVCRSHPLAAVSAYSHAALPLAWCNERVT